MESTKPKDMTDQAEGLAQDPNGEAASPSSPVEKEAASPISLHTHQTAKESVPADASLEFVLDLPLRVSAELGRARLTVQDLLKLQKGSVIELSKLAGEPIEILVNDRVLAKGEVVVVNEKFGVRLTEVVSHAQRVRQLGE